jgi:hypothetical protein
VQLPIGFTPNVFVEVVPFLNNEGLCFKVFVQDTELDWRNTSVVITGEEPSMTELRELGRIVWLAVTA